MKNQRFWKSIPFENKGSEQWYTHNLLLNDPRNTIISDRDKDNSPWNVI